MMETKENQSSNPKALILSKRAVIVGVVVVLLLFITSYILTFVLPKGSYYRYTEEDYVNGVDGITEDRIGSIKNDSYVQDDSLEGIKWWQFLLAPVMILSPTSESSGTVWAIVALLFIIGAVFTALDESGILVYMVRYVDQRFRRRKYLLLFLLCFVFMFLGSTAGMFEELIPLVPVVVMLSYALGWDAITGLAIVVLASCIGFSAGVANPFTVGISQTLGGLPMYSGIGMRLLTFALGFIVLMAFLFPYARKIERRPEKSMVYKDDLIRKKDFENLEPFVRNKNMDKGMFFFGGCILLVLIVAVVSIFWHDLASYVMYITIGIYLIAGIGACLLCKMSVKSLLKNLGKGLLTLLPAVALVLIAGGIRYVIEKGDVMDTIVYFFISLIEGQNKFVIVLILYAIIFTLEIFIQSGSAKAFLIMPMIFDICSVVGIDPQIAVLVFAFADGFANVLLPTNAGLLLILGMTTVDYGKWFRWSIRVQLAMFAATMGVLALALYVVY